MKSTPLLLQILRVFAPSLPWTSCQRGVGESGFGEAKLVTLFEVIKHWSALHNHTCFLPP